MRKLAFLILLVTLSCHQQNRCLSTKAAFDIGSASTKLVVAKVDHCQNKIVEILHQNQEKIAYKESLKNSDFFPVTLINSAIEKLAKLKNTAQKYHPKRYDAVATEAFRNATNGKAVIAQINKTLAIHAKILNQDQEAKLGFLAAKSQATKNNIISWDIGGGSMQFSDGTHIYRGKLASITFKNRIIAKIKKKKKTSSPNPLSPKEKELAIRMAIRTAESQIPSQIKENIYNQQAEVIGIGSVHYHSIARQTKKQNYTPEDLRMTLQKRAGLNDIQLGGDYAATDYTNLCLVYGFMKGLNIKKVKAVNINLAHGLLLSKQ